MGISVGYVDTFMSYPVCNGDGAEPHIDQQAHMAVSKLVEAENSTFSVEAENEICYNAGRLWNFMACFA